MAQYKGRVRKLFPSRYDGGSFALDEFDRLFFNTRNALPGFVQPGAVVEFTGELQRNGKSVSVDDSSVKEVVGTAASPAAASGGGGAQSYGDTQRKIQYQAARNSAIDMVANLVAAGALYDPAKTPLSKRAGIIEDVTDKFTAIYFEDTDNLGALERSPPPEEPAKAEPASAALPE